MRRAYTDILEGQMHYRFAGLGTKNILLLHMSGSSSDEYEKAGDILADRGFRVFAPDLLGFGSSDNPPRYYTMEDHARTIIEFMDSLHIDQAILYGNMATANMAARVAAKYPKRVAGLLLAHLLYNHDPQQYAKKKELPFFSRIIPQADGSHMKELWSRCAKYNAKPEIADARCRCLHQAGEWGESLHWALFSDVSFSECLEKIQAPAVIAAYGSMGDGLLQREASELIPNGKFDCYKDGTPYISRCAPEKVVNMIVKYFESY